LNETRTDGDARVLIGRSRYWQHYGMVFDIEDNKDPRGSADVANLDAIPRNRQRLETKRPEIRVFFFRVNNSVDQALSR
jgi:hypothetical protein